MSENSLLKIATLENKIQALDAERKSLVQELNQLKKLSHKTSPVPVTQYSSSTDKIQLFKSLFRGREDVYPKRWENIKSGKAGYSPVCGNEWKTGRCLLQRPNHYELNVHSGLVKVKSFDLLS